jgi:hypothetical protein
VEGLGQELPIDDAHLVGGPALGVDARVRERLRPGQPTGDAVLEEVVLDVDVPAVRFYRPF